MSKQTSMIYEMNERGDVTRKAMYTLDAKKALICYVMQKQNNYNTWDYPNDLKGIRESDKAPEHFYYDYNGLVLAAYPC